MGFSFLSGTPLEHWSARLLLLSQTLSDQSARSVQTGACFLPWAFQGQGWNVVWHLADPSFGCL